MGVRCGLWLATLMAAGEKPHSKMTCVFDSSWHSPFPPFPDSKMHHQDPPFVLKRHPWDLNSQASVTITLSQHALQEPKLSSQDSHNTLHLMRRWEVHPHRWILFLWPAVDCLPQIVIAGFQLFFFFFPLWGPNSLTSTSCDLHRSWKVKM